MRIISIVNQKGGCGKTTTSVNLAAMLASMGRRVMLVDLDPQSHCAAALGVPEEEIEYSTIDLLLDPPVERMTPPKIAARTWEVVHGLRLLPSTVSLARAEAPGGGLMEAGDRDRRLRRGLEVFSESLDYCIVDCPPTIGLLTFNALRAADEVLVPVETGFLAARGAQRQWATLRAMAARIGQPMKVRVLPNLLHPERALDRELLAGLKDRFGRGVSPEPIRDHIAIREATAFGRAVVEHAPESDAAEDYRRLAAWIENGEAATVEPEVEPLHEEVAPTGAPRSEPAASPVAGGVRSVEVSARAAELVQRMRPRTGPGPVAGGQPMPPAMPRPFDRRVRISVPAALGRTIRIVGDLNHWQPDGVPLAGIPGLADDFVGIDLPANGPLRYRLLVDGKVMLDPVNPVVAEGPDGQPASVIALERESALVPESPGGDPTRRPL